MQSLDHFDIVIVGGGVIGLAAAYKISHHPQFQDLNLVLLERHAQFGQETSSRNSEVIHAGIYYPQDSLKARLCVEGKEQLYHFCRHHDIAHRRLGKLIVAGADQEAALADIDRRARLNGVDDLEDIPPARLNTLEPALAPGRALFSPSSGIIDSHAFMLTLLQQAQTRGLLYSPMTATTTISRHDRGYRVDTRCQDTPYSFTCERLVNAAGLWAQDVAASIVDLPDEAIPQQVLVKGNYFLLQGASPFSHLVYPVPEKNLQGLGVHVTLDMAGQVRFGPDTEAIETIDYAVDSAREAAFRRAIRRYYPGIDDRHITPAYSGIRPKLAVTEGGADFVIQSGTQAGFPGLVQLFGIESPGLTASLAVADTIIGQLQA